MAEMRMPQRASGKSYGERSAGTFVGLPVSVLLSLRRTGEFEVHYFARTLAAFHELDLQAFVEKVLTLTAGVQSPMVVGETISLAAVMRLKFRLAEGKADLMREVLAQHIRPVGFAGEGIRGILFRQDEIKRFLLDKRAGTDEKTRSVTETADMLNCDPTVVPGLIQHGLLKTLTSKSLVSTRVLESSIIDFNATYASLAGLAKSRGTHTKRLLNEFSNSGIELLTIPRSNGRAAQPFVKRSQLPHNRLA
jgi:hypothetical protein